MTPVLSVTSGSSPRTVDHNVSTRRSGSSTPATPLSTAETLTVNTGIIGASDVLNTLKYIPLGSILAFVPPSLSLLRGDDWTELDASRLASNNWKQLEPTFEAPEHRQQAPKTEAEVVRLAKKVDRLRSHLIQLLEAKWIRAEAARHVDKHPTNFAVIRLWILPNDVGRATVDRSSRKIRSALEHVVQLVTISTDVWQNMSIETAKKFDPWASPDESSLFYLFNTLPSPKPSPEKVENPFSKSAMLELLESKPAGLKSDLYPFQARSAALMLQREASDELYLDPRLEVRRAPNGQKFYYCPREMEFLYAPRYFSSQKSGVLAELMGSGKTVIALSLILATKNHMPTIPPQYQRPVIREKVGTLVQMAAAAVGRHAIPWRKVFASHTTQTGEFFTACEQELEKCHPSYEIPSNPIRFNRNATMPPHRTLQMCSTTIVVVPLNLLHQWCSELKKHIEEGELKVLVMDHNKKPLPAANELSTFDIVLFSRGRFEAEVRDGSDAQGRRTTDYKTPPVCNCPYIGSTRVRQCTCFRESNVYISPLRHLHFLRIMIDEGHSFSSSNSNAVQVAQKLVLAERRWIISGTPARDDLISVEVDLASNRSTTTEEDVQLLLEAALERRRQFDGKESTGAARTLGTLATHFLQIRPWSQGAEWVEHVYRHEDTRSRTLSAFSKCMGKTLEQLLVKTQPADMERDVVLPPLTHRVVRLKPSFFDKVTANLFVFLLTNNAVTSERTDVDYLFHPKSQGSRNRLITNLRLSNFFWSGWKESDIGGAVEIGCKYLLKEDVNCSLEDRQTLTDCIKFAEEIVLRSESWKAMSRTHEIGLFVNHWPGNAATWALAKDPAELYGATLLHQAQNHVNSRLNGDPTEELEAAGTAAVNSILAQSHELDDEGGKDKDLVKGMPASSIHVELSVERVRKRSALKSNASPKKGAQKGNGTGKESAKAKETEKTPVKGGRGKLNRFSASEFQTPRKRPDTGIDLLSDDALAHTRIIGTVSAKLSYLIDQILTYCQDEKILVFYDGDNCAYYLAQCLDILSVKHEIYAKGISNEHRSKYIVAFAQDPSLRVLLMDVRLGALGLNANAASRVYFVNPVCRPSIEAQAVKRAHRIGQTKPVHVETLILEGTIEEAMFERSKAMTRSEHLEAKTLEDDVQITDIIQNAKLLPISPEEATGQGQMARLRVPQQVFGRPGRMAAVSTPPKKRKAEVPGDTPQRKKANGTARLGMPNLEHNLRHACGGVPSSLSISIQTDSADLSASLSAPLATAQPMTQPSTQMQLQRPMQEMGGPVKQVVSSLFGDGGGLGRRGGM